MVRARVGFGCAVSGRSTGALEKQSRIAGQVLLWGKSRRVRAGVAAGLVVAVGMCVTWAVWPSDPGKTGTRARQYANFTQCLLTDAAGVNSPSARQAWAAMQQSSALTAARSQFLAIPSTAVQAEAAVYANTLIARGCDVIVAAGPVPVSAATVAAASTPGKHFVLIGDAAPEANTVVVASATPNPASVAAVLTAAFHGQFKPGTVTGQ